jgi:hypothetical protein
MKNLCLMVAAMLLPGMAAALPYIYPYNWMTGQEVVTNLLTETTDPAEGYRYNLTQHYVNGIKDGTQGITWCFTVPILPHELNRELAAAIRKRTPAELKGNAGPLIREELRRLYPCRSSKRGHQ